MMIFRPKFLIPLAILLSLLATYVVYQYLETQKESLLKDKNGPVPVIVAAVNLPAGLRLEEQHLKKVDWPLNILPAGTFSSVADVIDRVTRTELVSGEPILEPKLAPIGSSGGFSSLIPPGMRALTVSVNVVSGVSGFILPGARVDVLVTVSQAGKKEESTAKTILENVQVLAVDQTFERSGDDPVKVQSVTLLVTPDQAEKLALASVEGKLQLVLRNTADRNSQSTSGVKLQQLISSESGQRSYSSSGSTTAAGAKQNVTTNPQTMKIEVLRSNKREEVTFEKKE